MKPLLRCCLLMVSITACTSCGKAAYVVEGVIADAGTGKPLQQANVVAQWEESWDVFHGTYTHCYFATAAKTDEQGRYRMEVNKPSRYESSKANVRSVRIVGYKTGYAGSVASELNYIRSSGTRLSSVHIDLALKSSVESGLERLRELRMNQRYVSCHDAGEQERVYLSFLRALKQEGDALELKPYERYHLDYLANRITALVEGSDVVYPKTVRSPAFAAINSGRVLDLRFIVETGIVGVDERLHDDQTLLMAAASRGNVPMVSYLLEQGANAARTDFQGETALAQARRFYSQKNDTEKQAYDEVIGLLQAYGSDKNAPDAGQHVSEATGELAIDPSSYALTGNSNLKLKLQIVGGKIAEIVPVDSVDRDGEYIKITRHGNEQRSSITTTTQVRGKVYFKIALRGDSYANELQDYFIASPPTDVSVSKSIEYSSDETIVSDFIVVDWPTMEVFRNHMTTGYPGYNSKP